MKKAVIATLLSGAIAAPAFAASESNLADADKVFNMDNAQTMELAALSSEEMESTEGALAPWVIGGGIGALAGGVGYIRGWYNGNYFWDTSRFIGNTATGSLAGATFGSAGALAGGGLSTGANIWRVNSFSFNSGDNSGWRQ